MQQVHRDGTAQIAADHPATLMTEHVVNEKVDVATPGGEVVHIVGRQVRVAVAAQVGRDHLMAGLGQRRDVAPPDAFRLGIAVQEQQRIAANTFVDERQRQAVAPLAGRDLPSFDR